MGNSLKSPAGRTQVGTTRDTNSVITGTSSPVKGCLCGVSANEGLNARGGDLMQIMSLAPRINENTVSIE